LARRSVRGRAWQLEEAGCGTSALASITQAGQEACSGRSDQKRNVL
jgi:hypothetical protein